MKDVFIQWLQLNGLVGAFHWRLQMGPCSALYPSYVSEVLTAAAANFIIYLFSFKYIPHEKGQHIKSHIARTHLSCDSHAGPWISAGPLYLSGAVFLVVTPLRLP